MSKEIMFCPKCLATFQTDQPDYNIHPYETEKDHGFNNMNQALFENCECDNDYIYLEEISKEQLIIMLSKSTNLNNTTKFIRELSKHELEYLTEIVIKEKESLEEYLSTDYLSTFNIKSKFVSEELLIIKNILKKLFLEVK